APLEIGRDEQREPGAALERVELGGDVERGARRHDQPADAQRVHPARGEPEQRIVERGVAARDPRDDELGRLLPQGEAGENGVERVPGGRGRRGGGGGGGGGDRGGGGGAGGGGGGGGRGSPRARRPAHTRTLRRGRGGYALASPGGVGVARLRGAGPGARAPRDRGVACRFARPCRPPARGPA